MAWLHDLSPVAVDLGLFPIRWYGISYALGFFIGWLLLRALAKRGLALIPPERTPDMVITIAIGAVLGGRIGYVLIYQPSLITEVTDAFPWWGVLRVNDGGMASHGGIVGAILGAILVARGHKNDEGERVGRVPALHVIDLMAALAPLGLMLGRLANFVNGELLGRIVAQPGQPAPWWAVKYPQEVFSGHDAQVVYTPGQAAALDRIIDAHRIGAESDYFAWQRVLAAIQHGDNNLAEQVAPLISARHPSQLYQAAAEGLLLFLALWFIWRKPRLPGVVGCWFLILYGVGRITTEFWRLPDVIDHPRIYGLSRGQWLSVAMIAAGLTALAVILKRGGTRLGGWLTPTPSPTPSPPPSPSPSLPPSPTPSPPPSSSPPGRG